MLQSGLYWSLSGWLSWPWRCFASIEHLLSLMDWSLITGGNNWNHDVCGSPWKDRNHWVLHGRLCHYKVCYLLATMGLKLTLHQDIIWLNVTIAIFTSIMLILTGLEQNSPMDEPKLMYSFNCHNTLGNIEPCHVLGKSVVFYEHGHEVSTREKFHD